MDEDVLDIWGGGFKLLGFRLHVRIKKDSECSQKRHEQHVFIPSVQLSGLPSGFASRWLQADASATSFSRVVMRNCGGLFVVHPSANRGLCSLSVTRWSLSPGCHPQLISPPAFH